MGGEGAMMAANQSLKSNRSQLSKGKRSFGGLAHNQSGIKTEYNFPEATKHDIIKLRNKLQKEHVKRHTKQVVLLSVIYDSYYFDFNIFRIKKTSYIYKCNSFFKI